MGGLLSAQAEKRREAARDWYARNRKKRLKQNKAWRDANKSAISAARKATYDPQKQRARFEKWYATNSKRVVDTTRKWRKANPEKHKFNARTYLLKKNYGMSHEEYETLLRRQKGRCAICRCLPSRRLHVDHCHRTGKIRGLLCNRCNLGIGYFDDCPTRLTNAAAYVKRKRNG